MSKRFLSSMLVLLFFVGAASMFTSCKDYDDDIKNLQEQIDKNAKAIDQINSLVTDGSVISDVRKVADGIEVVMANGTTYKITNGTNATVWTIGEDGYWYKDGQKTDYYAIGKDGANGINGTDGTNGTNGKDGQDGQDGKDGIYYVPNPETGCWDIYNGDGTLKESTKISWKAATNEITAVKDGSDLKLYNVKTTDGYADFTVALSNVLRGFVFQPEVYVDGVPAIRVAQFGYNPLNMTRMDNGKNGDGENGTPKGLEEYTTSTNKVYKSRKTYVKYHVNPTNANVEDLKNLKFVVQANDEYVKTRAPRRAKASDDFNAEAKFVDFSNGMLTVEVVVYGEPATAEHISVIALQTARQDGENVTSDYATVVKSNLNDIHIADKARFNAKESVDYHYRTILHSKDNSCDHIGIKNYAVTHLNDTEGETCDLELAWNNANGINIWDYVMAHEIANPCIDATGSLTALGFTWKLELVKNFTLGVNETDQAEYVDFNSETGILKVKEKYGESAIDRTPVIRVRIMDGEKTVKVAYIKVKIVRVAAPPVDYCESFMLGENFKFNCQNEDALLSYDYKDFSIQILKKYGMSKDEFHTTYPEAFDIQVVPFQFKDANDKLVTVTKEYGYVKEHIITEDTFEEGTHVLEWFLTPDELWALANQAASQGSPVTIYNRFRYYNPDTDRHFDIVLIAHVDPIETYHVNKINNNGGEYADNYWYEDVRHPGDVYGFTRFNVAVPNPEGQIDPTLCDFVNDLNAAFKNSNGEIVLTSSNSEFKTKDIEYYFHSHNKRVVQVQHPGTRTARSISIEKNGDYELVASGTDCFGKTHSKEWIARINNNGSAPKNTLIYNKNSVLAKELMNYIITEAEAHEAPESDNLLEKKNVMEVYIGLRANICGENGSTKRQINVIFHRKNGDAGKDYYVGHILKPVYLYHKYVDNYFIDGVDVNEAHSYIDLADYLDIPKFHDWRKREFVNNENFWKYYGIEQKDANGNWMGFVGDIDKMLESAKCNLKINGNTDWKPIPSTIIIGYQQTPESFVGYLTYKNNGINVEENFQIRTDIVINYGWGTYIIPDVEIEVKKTKDTPF